MAYFKVHNTQEPCCYWFASGGVTASLSTALLTGTICCASFKVKGEWVGHLSSGGAEEGLGWLLLEMPQRFYKGDWRPLQDLPSFCKFPWSQSGWKEVGLCCQLLSGWLSSHPPILRYCCTQPGCDHQPLGWEGPLSSFPLTFIPEHLQPESEGHEWEMWLQKDGRSIIEGWAVQTWLGHGWHHLSSQGRKAS